MLPPLIWCILAASYMLRRIFRRWSARQQRVLHFNDVFYVWSLTILSQISRLRALKVKRYIVPEDDEKGTIASGKVCHNSSCVICLEEFKLGTSIKVNLSFLKTLHSSQFLL